MQPHYHPHNHHRRQHQQKLRNQRPRQSASHQPHHRAPELRFFDLALDDVIRHARHVRVDEDGHHDGGAAVDDGGQGAGGDAHAGVEHACVQRREDTYRPQGRGDDVHGCHGDGDAGLLAQARDVGGLGQAGGGLEVGQTALEDGVQQELRYRPVYLEVLDGAAEGALEGGDQYGAEDGRQAGGE